MPVIRHLSILCFALALPGLAGAADFSDPTWPCVQRKVGALSVGLMWPHPIPDGPLPDAMSADGDAVIAALSLRRVGLEDAAARIADFVAAHPTATTGDLGRIFRGVFEQVQTDRSAIIGGIERYSLKQIALAKAIDDTRVEMNRMMQADAPDYDRVDALEERLDWDERIFRDRAQSLTYVCESPVLLEQRIYAIGQALLAHAPDQ